MDIAWLALIVSLFAAGLSWWNTQRAVKKDSVFWVQRDTVQRAGERAATWRVSIYNYGHGVAGDVRIFVMHQLRDEPEELHLTPTVSLGGDVTANLNVDGLSNQTLETLKLTVKWRQAPAFERERSQDFRFPIEKKHGGPGA